MRIRAKGRRSGPHYVRWGDQTVTLVLQGLEVSADDAEEPGHGVWFIVPTAVFLIDERGVRRLGVVRVLAVLLPLVGLAALAGRRRDQPGRASNAQ